MNCSEEKKAVRGRYLIPVSFKPEKGSAKAPNNTRFKFDVIINTDNNTAGAYSLSGGYGGYGWYGGGGYYDGYGRNNNYRDRGPGRPGRAPDYGRGCDVRNGVASGYIDVTDYVLAELAKTSPNRNFVITVSRVAIKGYTINPASITIRFSIRDDGRMVFNTHAQRADFTYVRDAVAAKKPAHNNPKTGDATNVALWSSMAVTSMAGVVVALKKRMSK